VGRSRQTDRREKNNQRSEGKTKKKSKKEKTQNTKHTGTFFAFFPMKKRGGEACMYKGVQARLDLRLGTL
jgi:hypothetical protein